jgi:hypothetical protein
MNEEKRIGRPPGRDFPVVKQLRLGTDDAQRLADLAAFWGISEAAAMRRAIKRVAEEERPEEWREAAARLAEYYRTDPEVQEWQNADFGNPEFLGEPDPELGANHPGARAQAEAAPAQPAQATPRSQRRKKAVPA